MLLRWLTTVFPRDMQRGWLLIKVDLGFWCALAAVLALLAVVPLAEQPEASDTIAALAALGLATVLRIVLAPLVLVIAALRFAAIRDGRELAWAPLMGSVKRRLVPVLLAWLLAAAMCRVGSMFAQAAIVAILQTAQRETSEIRAWAELVGWAVFVVLLARFAFVPFLAGLRRGRDFHGSTASGGAWSRLTRRFAWPLVESNRLTRDMWRELLPYLVLGVYAPAAAAAAPGVLRPFVSFALHLLAFTALAVLFAYYAERGLPAGAEVPAPASSPAAS